MLLLSLTSCCTILWRHQFCSSSIVRDLVIADENNALTSLHKFAFCQRQKYHMYYYLHTTTFIDNSYSTEDTICKTQLLCYREVSSLETCLNILINIPMTCLHLGNVGTSVKLSLETLQCSMTPPSCGFSN